MVKPGYKQTEIGIIPEEWDVLQISDIVENGKVPSGIYKDIKLYGNGCLIIKLGDVFRYDYFLPELAQRVQLSEDEIKTYKVKLGDIIVALASVKLEGVGKVMLVNNLPEQAAYDHNVALLRLKSSQSATFICNLLKSSIIRKSIASKATQVGTTFLKSSSLVKIYVPLPPLPEQKAIAAALSDTDAWINNLEQLIAKKRQIKQGAMQQLLTPKKDWEVKKLGEVIDVYRGGSPRPIQNFMTNKLDGINWIKIGDTSATGKYIFEANEKIIPDGENYSRKVLKGDFLLSNSMSFGRPYILKIDGCIHDGWLVLQNYKSNFESEFLYYLLLSKIVIDQYKSKAAGSSVLNLNKELVSTVLLTFPSINEQTRIATILSDMDEEIESLAQQLTKAQQIKQGMMQELLTGRVRLL